MIITVQINQQINQLLCFEYFFAREMSITYNKQRRKYVHLGSDLLLIAILTKPSSIVTSARRSEFKFSKLRSEFINILKFAFTSGANTLFVVISFSFPGISSFPYTVIIDETLCWNTRNDWQLVRINVVNFFQIPYDRASSSIGNIQNSFDVFRP